jgi:hypothetical protein
VDPRAGLDDVEEKFLTLPGLEIRPLSRPARSQLLYRLRHPGPSCLHVIVFNYILKYRDKFAYHRHIGECFKQNIIDINVFCA